MKGRCLIRWRKTSSLDTRALLLATGLSMFVALGSWLTSDATTPLSLSTAGVGLPVTGSSAHGTVPAPAERVVEPADRLDLQKNMIDAEVTADLVSEQQQAVRTPNRIQHRTDARRDGADLQRPSGIRREVCGNRLPMPTAQANRATENQRTVAEPKREVAEVEGTDFHSIACLLPSRLLTALRSSFLRSQVR